MASSPRDTLLTLALTAALAPQLSCTLLTDFNQCTSAADCDANATCAQGLCVVAEGLPIVEIVSNVSQDTTWSADRVYVLKGLITVTPSTTLTIEAGTTIKAERQSALVVREGGKLIARGTRARPIVFTSAKPEGQRLAGDWGGVALLGKARVNRTNAVLNILTDEAEASFGGTDDTWNCGELEYVRIEFGGAKVKGEHALNGLTFAGCGSETFAQRIHLHYGADDGLEFFGGTVSPRYVLITRSQDDGVDIDLGWRGTMQFLAIQQDAAGDVALESDNLKEAPGRAPLTAFRIYNYTFIGSRMGGTQRSMMFKDGGGGLLSHGIVMGAPLEAIEVQGEETIARALADEVVVQHTLFYEIGEGGEAYFANAARMVSADMARDMGDEELGADMASDMAEDEPKQPELDKQAHFSAPRWENSFGVDPGIAAPYDLAAPSWVPARGAVVGVPAPPEGFDTLAAYRGAFAPDAVPWTEGWTSYPLD